MAAERLANLDGGESERGVGQAQGKAAQTLVALERERRRPFLLSGRRRRGDKSAAALGERAESRCKLVASFADLRLAEWRE